MARSFQKRNQNTIAICCHAWYQLNYLTMTTKEQGMHTCQWRSHQRLEDIGKGSHTAWFRQCSNTSQTLRGVTGFRVAQCPQLWGWISIDCNRCAKSIYHSSQQKTSAIWSLFHLFLLMKLSKSMRTWFSRSREINSDLAKKIWLTRSGIKYIYIHYRERERQNLLTNFKHHFNGTNNNGRDPGSRSLFFRVFSKVRILVAELISNGILADEGFMVESQQEEANKWLLRYPPENIGHPAGDGRSSNQDIFQGRKF